MILRDTLSQLEVLISLKPHSLTTEPKQQCLQLLHSFPDSILLNFGKSVSTILADHVTRVWWTL